MRIFRINLNEKTIAEGVQFSDGYVVILWKNYKRALKTYKNFEEFEDIDIEEGYIVAWINKNPV